MKVLTSRVVLCTIVSVFTIGFSALADNTIPVVDFKTVTSKAYVDSLISNNDISSHTINGAPLSSVSTVFAGKSTTAAETATKEVTISGINTLVDGLIVVVTPSETSTAGASNLKINDLVAKPMRYQNSALTTSTDGYVWVANTPSMWVYDATAQVWRFAGYGRYDSNTTYSAMSVAEGIAGTATSSRVMRADYLKQIIAGIAGDTISNDVLAWNTVHNTAVNNYSTEFDDTTGNWPAADGGKLIDGNGVANALALKQNRITTGLVEFEGDDATINVPSVVTTNAAGTGVSGNQIGFMTLSAFAPTGSPFPDFKDRDDGDSFVPSAALVAEELTYKQDILPAAWTDTTSANMASTGGQTIDLATTKGLVGRRYITAGGSQPLTQKTGADNVILYINGTKTLAQYQTSNFGGTGTINQNYIKGALVSLELLKDVYSELNAKITNNALPTGTTGTVVTYNGTNAQTGVQQFTETAIVDAPDYTGTGGSLVNGDSITSVEYVENALATKQPIIQPSTVNGKTQIVVKPAYGGNAGEIGYLTLDTSSLTTGNDSTVPSSKLLNTLLGGKYDTDYILDTRETDIYASDYSGAPSWATTSGTANLYRFPGAVNGDNWASKVLYAWSTQQNVPTMDTLANSLAGLYDAVGDLVDNQILDYGETGSNLLSASVPVPTQIEYAGAQFLGDGNQLFWLPQLASNGVQEATTLLNSYSTNKIVPSMDELAYALDGVLQTHETTNEWQHVADSYRLGSTRTLMEIAKLINGSDPQAVALNNSGYLQTFAPSLEALMNESYALYQNIDTKQNKLSGTNGALVTYGATAGQTGSKAIATTITNNANTVPNTAAVYNAVNARQIKIPQAGRVRDASGTESTISDWTTASVKGTALVTKTTSDGVVGERKIFEAGDTYTNNTTTNIQIATIGAVMENTFTKTCAEYRPGTTGETAANCWLWEITSNTVTTACGAGGTTCSSNADCCSGNCNSGVCKFVTPVCATAGQSCAGTFISCCDGLTCDSQTNICVSSSGRT